MQQGEIVAADSFNRLSDGAKVAVRMAAQPTNSPQPNKKGEPVAAIYFRPVATSLLMAAILFAGIAYRQLPSPHCRKSTIQPFR